MFSADFNPTFSYSLNESVTANGKSYTSLQNANSGNAPGTSPLFWKLSDVAPAPNVNFPAGDPRNVAGDSRNVGNFPNRNDPNFPNRDNPNYDARLDPRSQNFNPAMRDRNELGGVGDRLGADYRAAASDAEWHALNHSHDDSPYPGNHGNQERSPGGQNRNNPNFPEGQGGQGGQGGPGGPYTRHNPDGYAPPFSEPKPRREATEKEKEELEVKKAAYLKRTTSP